MRSNINIYVFRGLQIVAWIIFVGLCIEAGGLLVNYVFSVYKPSVISNLYQKLNLMDMYEKSQWAFWVSTEAFILMAAIIYVISIIFKRGVELQQENELTV